VTGELDYGEDLGANGEAAAGWPLRFSSKYSDAETGLTYYGYRYFTPILVKWLTRDPLEEQGGLNLYGFVGNDPLNAVDPWRLSEHWSALGKGLSRPRAYEHYKSWIAGFDKSEEVVQRLYDGQYDPNMLSDHVGVYLNARYNCGDGQLGEKDAQRAFLWALAQQGLYPIGTSNDSPAAGASKATDELDVWRERTLSDKNGSSANHPDAYNQQSQAGQLGEYIVDDVEKSFG
jgi:RHS repeat-associated protein